MAITTMTRWTTTSWVRLSTAPVALALLAGGHALLHRNTTRRQQHLEALVSARTQALRETHVTLERRHRTAEGMRDVLAALNSNQPLDQVMTIIITRSLELLRAYAVAMGEIGATPGSLCTLAQAGTAVEMDDPSVSAQLFQLVFQAIGQGDPVIASSPLNRHGRNGPSPVAGGETAVVVAMPIVVQAGNFRGGLLLFYTDRDLVTPGEIELVAMFAAQAVLAIENARLKAAAQEVATVTERSRVARELHDSVTQSLYGIILNTDAALLALTAGHTDKVEQRLHQLKTIAHEAMTELRLLVYELRPSILEEQGLYAALYERLEAVEMRAGIEVALEIEGAQALPLDVQNELFWVALEGLNNVVKHAHAHHIWLHIDVQDDRCRLTLNDDGRGFDVGTAQRYGGYGLKTISERLEQVGGTLAIHSQSGAGTALVIEVPL